jgi:hypothetical protein
MRTSLSPGAIRSTSELTVPRASRPTRSRSGGGASAGRSKRGVRAVAARLDPSKETSHSLCMGGHAAWDSNPLAGGVSLAAQVSPYPVGKARRSRPRQRFGLAVSGSHRCAARETPTRCLCGADDAH